MLIWTPAPKTRFHSSAYVEGQVTATNIATGVPYSTESNGQGIYRLLALPPSRYKVTAGAAGFKTFEQGPITLQVNDVIELAIALQLGDATDLTKPDAIGMGSYNSDSHDIRRFVNAQGMAENEGDMQVAVKPYQIPFRAMLPKRAEMENLLNPVT